jgi:transcriptional regulator with XRE-family HTH domain
MNAKGMGDDLAGRMRAVRAYARIDQEALAERLGVSSGTVSAWERGKTRIPTIARPGVVEALVEVSGWDRAFFTEGVGR